MEDTLRPDRLVIGSASAAAGATLRGVYADAMLEARDSPFISTDFETAELVKVAANAFLATKISFINAFSEVTETVGGNVRTLAEAIGLDARIGGRFLNAGIGFGGGCLPKDIRALQAPGLELGLDSTMRFLNEVDLINLRRRDRAVHCRRDAAGHPGGQARRRPRRRVQAQQRRRPRRAGTRRRRMLQEGGADVRVYDPQGTENARKVHPELHFEESMGEAVRGGPCLCAHRVGRSSRNADPAAAPRSSASAWSSTAATAGRGAWCAGLDLPRPRPPSA